LPAAVGLSVLSKEILIVLFEWGSFRLSDVYATVPILIIYALALPFYSITTFAVRCFYAGKDMKLPVRLSIWFLILNTIFSLIFMNLWGVYGLAFANLLSAILHTFFIGKAMKDSYNISFSKGLKQLLVPILIGLISIALISLFGKGVVSSLDCTYKMHAFISVIVLIPLSVGAYFSVLQFFKISDLSSIKLWKSNNETHG
jgi:peptidoglycan biosynthesis protein MviN/MurJ (putative lipid II flippase)